MLTNRIKVLFYKSLQSTRKRIIPKIAKVTLQAFPTSINNSLVRITGNHMLKGQNLTSSLQEIDEKTISLFITDLNKKLSISIHKGQFISRIENTWDVKISGSLENFHQLLWREQDPDTLFFQRKLKLEGDIETGLLVKNLLDSIEYNWPNHFKAIFKNMLL